MCNKDLVLSVILIITVDFNEFKPFNISPTLLVLFFKNISKWKIIHQLTSGFADFLKCNNKNICNVFREEGGGYLFKEIYFAAFPSDSFLLSANDLQFLYMWPSHVQVFDQ